MRLCGGLHFGLMCLCSTCFLVGRCDISCLANNLLLSLLSSVLKTILRRPTQTNSNGPVCELPSIHTSVSSSWQILNKVENLSESFRKWILTYFITDTRGPLDSFASRPIFDTRSFILPKLYSKTERFEDFSQKGHFTLSY